MATLCCTQTLQSPPSPTCCRNPCDRPTPCHCPPTSCSCCCCTSCLCSWSCCCCSCCRLCRSSCCLCWSSCCPSGRCSQSLNNGAIYQRSKDPYFYCQANCSE